VASDRESNHERIVDPARLMRYGALHPFGAVPMCRRPPAACHACAMKLISTS
jgi:hypothetical protein